MACRSLLGCQAKAPGCFSKMRWNLKQLFLVRIALPIPPCPPQPPFPQYHLLHTAIHTAAWGSSRQGSRLVLVPSTQGRQPLHTTGPATACEWWPAAQAIAGHRWSGGAG